MIKFISIIILVCLISQAGSEWRENNPMSDARTGASIIFYDAKFYIIGGRDHTEFLSDIQVYDPAADSWDTTSVPEMFTPRANASAVLLQDKIYVIGGRNKRGACKEVEALDLKTNQWIVKRTLRGPRSGLTAQVYKDSLLILCKTSFTFSTSLLFGIKITSSSSTTRRLLTPINATIFCFSFPSIPAFCYRAR